MAKTTAQTTLILGDAAEHSINCDMLCTDPPYDMSGSDLARILGHYNAPHLLLITTMRQLLDFLPRTEWRLNFDFVWDGVMPKKSRSYQQPNYVHQTGVYLTRPGVKSAFDRRLRPRSDTFDGNGYWPTLFRAPRDNVQEHGHAKNAECMTDLLGSFAVNSVCDPFAGAGTTAIAAFELGIRCTLIERDPELFAQLKRICKFMGAYGLEVSE